VSPERFPVSWIGQTVVIRLPAEVDITNADAVREDMLALINRGAAALIADMSTTTFCDSAGVNALVRAYKRARASGAVVRLAVAAPAVQRVLSLIGVDHFITGYPTVAAALAGLDPRGGGSRPPGPGDSPHGHGEQHGRAVRTDGDGDVVADPL
jgi:anti-sigma B factor antagonist